jgi:hypothetical protein
MDMVEWLRGLRLEQYLPAFRDNNIDGEVLRRLIAVARRPRGADPPGLAPSPERALPARADQGRLVGAAGEAIWARCAKASGHPVLGSSDVIAAEVE